MDGPTNIDPTLQAALDTTKAQSEKATREIERWRRDVKVAVGAVCILLTILGYFAFPPMVANQVAKVLSETPILEALNAAIQKANNSGEEADKVLKKILDENREAQIQVNHNIAKLNASNTKTEEYIRQMENMLKIRSIRYYLEMPGKSGRYDYQTSIKYSDFRSAILSGWNTYGGGSSCKWNNQAEIMTYIKDNKWILRIDKFGACTKIDIRIIYLPSKIVNTVEEKRGLQLIK